jgi:hypothetical protein
LGIGKDGIRLQARLVLQQPVDDIDGFPYAWWDEVREDRHVEIADHVESDCAPFKR